MSARKPLEAGGKGSRSVEWDGRKYRPSKSDHGKFMAKLWPKDDDSVLDVARSGTWAAMAFFKDSGRVR